MTPNRLLALITLLIAVTISTFAQNKVSLFVYGDISNSDKFVIESKIAEQLSKDKNFILLNRSNDFLDMLTDEIVFQNSGEVSNSEMCKLGQRWGAKYVIGVMAVETREQLMLTAKLINVTTGAELFSVTNHKEIKRANDLIYLSTLLGTNISAKLKNAKL